MTDRKDEVTLALIEAVILDLLGDKHAQRRAELYKEFQDPGDREVGKLLDQPIGTVALQKGREIWRVADPEAFLQWVTENYPQHLQKSVGTVFRDWVLLSCKAHGGLLDEATGEVEEVPGVVKQVGAPILKETPDKDAGRTVREWLGVEATERLGIES